MERVQQHVSRVVTGEVKNEIPLLLRQTSPRLRSPSLPSPTLPMEVNQPIINEILVDIPEVVSQIVPPQELPQAPPSSSSSSDRNEGGGPTSPPPNCSICLGKLINTSFTDSCLHQFCFTCLLQWSKIKHECPLCKQTFKSIIHNVRSEEDYDQYHVPRDMVSSRLPPPLLSATHILNLQFDLERYVQRAHILPSRRYGMYVNTEEAARRQQITNVPSQMYRRHRRGTGPPFRRNICILGDWSNTITDTVRFFPSGTDDFYRRYPEEIDRLIPWIRVELRNLLNGNEHHINLVTPIITRTLSHCDIRSAEFRDIVRPYIGDSTPHFAHELLLFAMRSQPRYLDRYRSQTRDRENLPLLPSLSITSSDDSDVHEVERDRSSISSPHLMMSSHSPSHSPLFRRSRAAQTPQIRLGSSHMTDMPGPSTVAETFQANHMMTINTEAPDVLTISSNSSSSSDECEVIGYVKPRHERTPEIIHLVSSDEAEIETPAEAEATASVEPSTQSQSRLLSDTKPANLENPEKRRDLEFLENESDPPASTSYGTRLTLPMALLPPLPPRRRNRRWSTSSGSTSVTAPLKNSSSDSSSSESDHDRSRSMKRFQKLFHHQTDSMHSLRHRLRLRRRHRRTNTSNSNSDEQVPFEKSESIIETHPRSSRATRKSHKQPSSENVRSVASKNRRAKRQREATPSSPSSAEPIIRRSRRKLTNITVGSTQTTSQTQNRRQSRNRNQSSSSVTSANRQKKRRISRRSSTSSVSSTTSSNTSTTSSSSNSSSDSSSSNTTSTS